MPKLSPTIFREYDIRGLVDQDLTEEAVQLVGKALGTRLRAAGGRKAAVGRDARLSGERFRDAMVSGLTSTGLDVLDLGIVPTPLTYFAAHTAGGGRDLHDHRLAQPAGVQRPQGRPGLGDAPRRGDPGAPARSPSPASSRAGRAA